MSATSSLQEYTKEASEYVDSVMAAHQIAEVRSPLTVTGSRKRNLSNPEESCVEEIKNDDEVEPRDIKKAKDRCVKIVREVIPIWTKVVCSVMKASGSLWKCQ